jgi:hypothetical protein
MIEYHTGTTHLHGKRTVKDPGALLRFEQAWGLFARTTTGI